jgi:ABC-type transport system substrate-binding protein
LDGKQKWVARVPIVQGLNWTDDIPFNATDVAFSYNAMLDIDNKGFAYGDYWFLMNRTEVVDPYTVDFIYNPGMGPDYDFAGYNAHGWGIGMIPWHQLKNEDLTTWRNAPFNSDPVPKSKGGKGVECLGPYVPISQNPSDKSITFERRDQYINVLGWANTLPQYYVMKIIQDDGARWTQLNNLEVDVIEYPTKPLQDWINMNTTGKHKVYSFKYPAMHPLWMNLQNPILSNRYVRLAIAHAIPYPKIFNDILPGWGVSQAYYGKSFVLPIHGSFNTALGNYEYNIDKAKQYMDMWRYSQATLDPSKGPRGDHDFSGYVGVDDFPIWAKWRGKTPSQWTFKPGNDIDPDNDNDADVDVADYTSWAANYGKRYPFNGAW